ncbi:hypothetical protein Tco_0959494 [Tanacetum coccineum]
MVQAVKNMVQHEPHFILEVVDNGFGSLAMWVCVNLKSRRVFNLKGLIKRNKGGDGGRRNKAFLHMLGILDSLLDVLFTCVKLVKFLLYLVSSHGWLGLSTQPTSREKVKALGANGVMSGSRVRVIWIEVGGGVVRVRVVSRVVVKVMLVMLRGFWVEELALDAMEYEEGCLQVRTRISVFIIRIEGIGVEMIGMVQGQQYVRKRKVFRFDEFRIHKSKVFKKTSKHHSIWQGAFEGIFDDSDSFCQKIESKVSFLRILRGSSVIPLMVISLIISSGVGMKL